MPIFRTRGSITRRDLLKTSAGTAALAALPHSFLVQLGRTPEPVPPIDDPRLKALAMRALEAATSAGATYADVRLTHTRERGFWVKATVNDEEKMTVGVRALVGGYWGFAASPVWSPDELARLGREAVHQAKANAGWKPREVELAPVPVVADGHWVTPIKLDPFETPIEEIRDHLGGLEIWATRLPGVTQSGAGAGFWVEEKAFGSTGGSYCTQRRFLSSMAWDADFPTLRGEFGGAGLQSDGWVGQGWEILRDDTLYEQFRERYEKARRAPPAPPKKTSVEVGRYDVVFGVDAMANVLANTLGEATQLDRALGYEANAGGTSYLNQPFEMLGSYQAGAPLLSVTANRSEPGAAATVKWDDEGVSPEPFTLVKDGVLTDFQTMRESAGWLKDTYAKRGMPFHSHGCAAAERGDYVPLVMTPNLQMAPGKEALSEEDLIASLGKGLYFGGFNAQMDFQRLNGFGISQCYEVRQGKLVARIVGPDGIGVGVLFRSPEFWKGLLALGGPASARRIGSRISDKGEPIQYGNSPSLAYSVTAVPAVVKQLTIIDPTRKA